MQNEALAKRLTERYDTLKGLRSPWETIWQEIAKYVMPRRVPGLNGAMQSPSFENEALLFDTTAVQANMTLANGQLAWMSPLEAPWFQFDPHPGQGDDAKRWLSEKTRIAQDELAISNAYTVLHEAYLDRGGFGTCCVYIEPGKRTAINMQIWPVGSFVIDEDESGMVDTVMREFKLTARQAVAKFGEKEVSKKILEAFVKGGQEALRKFDFLHVIYPREDAERDKAKLDAPNMPWASVYLETESKHLCRVSGYEEQPFMVSRYLEWGSNTGGLFGWSPAFMALPDARQVNFLQKMLDALAEKAAFPPTLAPEELEGEIDPNAHGVTYFSKDMQNALPKEWMTGGRYDIGLERVQERQRAINEAFHVDLFKMFAQLEKQMTAREVAERSSEKLIQFSPTFSRLTSELFNPLLERVFGILMRAGRFGSADDVPESMLVNLGNVAGLVTPRVQYTSRIALALRSLPALGYQRTLERLAVTATVSPDVLDNFDFDKAERATALIDGVPAEFLRTEQQVGDMRKQRAAAAQEAAKQAQAMQAAEAVAKVGSVKSDSPVGNIIASNLPGAQAA